ncbi:hypothetical protein HOY82DRAFT_629853 [Tuber indicum]|nr:hypothetical protein HOY82DRAFT_629853 [Tuber indicum]
MYPDHSMNHHTYPYLSKHATLSSIHSRGNKGKTCLENPLSISEPPHQSIEPLNSPPDSRNLHNLSQLTNIDLEPSTDGRPVVAIGPVAFLCRLVMEKSGFLVEVRTVSKVACWLCLTTKLGRGQVLEPKGRWVTDIVREEAGQYNELSEPVL